MRKEIVFVIMICLFTLIGCTTKTQRPFIKTPSKLGVIIPGGRSFYSNPTRGYIRNGADNLFIKVWLEPEFKTKEVLNNEPTPAIQGEPNFILSPNQIREEIMSLGEHFIYAEAWMFIDGYGWQKIETVIMEIFVDFRIGYGRTYGWNVTFREYDFRF
ncbi:MAG: hypothetical protein V1829_01155 [bacterium]